MSADVADAKPRSSPNEIRAGHPNIRPRDAATLIVIDRTGPSPKVLLGRRHERHKFMPGKYVFPGGGVEPGDRRMNVAGALPAMVETRLLSRMNRPSSSKARALALAAIRETFEEAGLLIGARDHGAPENPPAGSWSDFAALGVFPSLEALHFIARAITPPGRPRRFDARFFAVDAEHVAHRVERVAGADAELLDLVWKPIAEAYALDLPGITRTILGELEARIAAGFHHHLPAPFFYESRGRALRSEL